jgi:putative ABC transport system permease protein
MLRFAWLNLVTRPARSALAVVGLTIPILAIVGLFSVTKGIRHLMGDTLARINGLMVMRENAPAPVFSDLSLDLKDKIRKVPGVRIVAPEVWKICPSIEGHNQLASAALSMLRRRGEQKYSSLAEMIMLQGQSMPEHLQIKSSVYRQGLLPKEKGGGRFLAPSDVGKYNVLISTKIARDYPNEDGSPKKVGETIRIGNKPFEIIGIYETGSMLVDETVVMEITTARELLDIDDQTVSAFYVEPEQGTSIGVMAQRIREAVSEVQVRSMSQFNLEVGDVMGRLDRFLLLTVGLALLVGGVGIANTMLMSTMERVVQFGVMRANGWTRRNVLGLVTIESTLLGLLSGLLATMLGAAGVFLLNYALSSMELSLELTPSLLVQSNLAAVLIAAIAGLYPAWRASRMTPMDAIRNEAS